MGKVVYIAMFTFVMLLTGIWGALSLTFFYDNLWVILLPLLVSFGAIVVFVLYESGR